MYNDYNELINYVEHHSKCSVFTCLHKKGLANECRYKVPWTLQLTSILELDDNGNPKFVAIQNDDHLNLHNPTMLSLWRLNIDCKPIISINVVIRYNAKYTSKVEKNL